MIIIDRSLTISFLLYRIILYENLILLVLELY